MMQFILGSQSPRRRSLVQLIDYPLTTTAVSVDEDSITHPDPALNVVETARLKAAAITAQLPPPREHAILITADTTVAAGAIMLNKPANAADARRMLQLLRARKTHEVHTGLVLTDLNSGRTQMAVHTAVVTMRAYTDAEIDAYVATGDPMDKAGAYAIQHPIFQPVAALEGCFLGVMGISICHLLHLLAAWELPLRANPTALHAAHASFTTCPLLQTVPWG